MKDHKHCKGNCWCLQERPYTNNHWKNLTIEPTIRSSSNLLVEGARAILVNSGRDDYEGYSINVSYR
jgi:hypothetical protein